MNLGAPRVGVTRGSSLFSAVLLVDGINHDQAGGPDVSLEDELGCPTCRGYTWVFVFSFTPVNQRDQSPLAPAALFRKKESCSTSTHPDSSPNRASPDSRACIPIFLAACDCCRH